MSNDTLKVKWQKTPNPQAIKFVVNQTLKESGKATFLVKEECENLPLVSSLLEILGVKQIYIQGNTLTVTHDSQMSEDFLIESVQSVLKTRMSLHDPAFLTEEESGPSFQAYKEDRSHLSKEIQEVEEILDRTVRPGLNADGGDVEVISYENDEIKILYQGACGGCPSAMMGTLDAIQNILRHELGSDGLKVTPV